MNSRRLVAALLACASAWYAVAGASELSTAPQQPAPGPPAQRLIGNDPAAPVDRASAQATLAQVAERRAELQREWAQRELECKRAFFVNPCLGTLRRDRLTAEQQLRQLELAAQQTLRDLAARDRNQREADRLAREESAREAELQQREANRRGFEARQLAAREDAAQRERDEAQRAQAAAARPDRREQRAPRAGSERPALPFPAR
jgi:colicin import membrane protein